MTRTITTTRFPWNTIDTVLLDMDGTLLDKYFDDYFWEKYVPLNYARKHRLTNAEAEKALMAKYRSVESTLQWTDLYYWTEQLDLDIIKLKNEIHHLINVHEHVFDFFRFIKGMNKKLCLVTNAHSKTLEIKLAKTNIGPFFDNILCSEEVGEAKEHPQFWHNLENFIEFKKDRTLFADDTEKVLQAAGQYGIEHLVHIARPSTRMPLRYSENFFSIADFGELL
ncbi:MAG: HAD-IA family hydrolase [Desulfopila sp.]|jgi:putative hydrolase of the HAD superfamily|nr:HAD-IA family hydrolase [Desulfopila sp.]